MINRYQEKFYKTHTSIVFSFFLFSVFLEVAAPPLLAFLGGILVVGVVKLYKISLKTNYFICISDARNNYRKH